MKVGVLTFHRAINYGAALQAYALVRKLNELGFSAELADYRNPHIENLYHKFSVNKVNSPKKALRFLKAYPVMEKRKKAFKEFWRNIPCSGTFESSDDLRGSGYDMFVSGSDQVWNPDCTKFDKTYFLDFAEKKQKASYAASFGVASLNEKDKEAVGSLLSDFEHIAVREKQGADIVKDLTGREASVVLDPTLLLDESQWREVAKPSGYAKKKYLLVYMLFNSATLMEFAEKKAKQQNLEIVCIGNGNRKGITYAKDIGPAQFLDLFFNADAVATNSFHGTAFSINLGKDFYVELHNIKNSRNSRMEDILELFRLKNRLVIAGESTEEKIDFLQVKKILEEERQKSVEYLLSIK